MEEFIRSLIRARDVYNQAKESLQRLYAEAEESGDYSDADECSADWNEQLSDELGGLISAAETAGLIPREA